MEVRAGNCSVLCLVGFNGSISKWERPKMVVAWGSGRCCLEVVTEAVS